MNIEALLDGLASNKTVKEKATEQCEECDSCNSNNIIIKHSK